MAERLRRLEWVFERTPVYFITACTHERRRILADARVHERLIQFAESGPEYGAWLGAYVLMPDHLHAFVALDDGDSHRPPLQLGGWIKSLKNALSKTLREGHVDAPHWQKGFFDRVLRSGESYSGKWDYVRNNPVRAGLVARPEDWPYCGQAFPLEYRRDRN